MNVNKNMTYILQFNLSVCFCHFILCKAHTCVKLISFRLEKKFTIKKLRRQIEKQSEPFFSTVAGWANSNS